MPQFIESIKYADRELYHINYHTRRFNRTRKKFFGAPPLNLADLITVPESAKTGVFKCRVLYGKQITGIQFISHTFRKINSLKLVEDNSVKYSYKFADREALQKLFDLRGENDDILIVKNGCITDSFSANVIFYDGHGWYTPDTPLLPGTCRARLLSEGKISSMRITPDHLSKFISVHLINAMQDINDSPPIPIKNIASH